jgi:hypothetical protein
MDVLLIVIASRDKVGDFANFALGEAIQKPQGKIGLLRRKCSSQ